MKKILALLLTLTMLLGFASCAKKVEVPSKSDVKKAAAEEYDMEFKVDSEDVSDDEKEAEWVLISKDGTLEVTVTWNAKNPDEFEFEDEELSAPTTTTTEEDPTTTTTEEDPTTTTTEASTPDSSENGGGANPNPSGAKYVNFDEMNFYINGKKYTLGKTTLQDLVDDGVPFKSGESENFANNLKGKYQSSSIKLDIGEGWTVSINVFNETDEGKPMNECYVNEISVYTSQKRDNQKILTFDFPFDTLTIDELKANSGEPNEKTYHNEDDPKFVADYLKWSKQGTKFWNNNYYDFEFYNNELRNFYMTYIP
ncbi:MAG: hypothetical protein IKZ42_07235 [Clostridiales bacterium]|nr:hypothetical protein [Clostridiales bacterium]